MHNRGAYSARGRAIRAAAITEGVGAGRLHQRAVEQIERLTANRDMVALLDGERLLQADVYVVKRGKDVGAGHCAGVPSREVVAWAVDSSAAHAAIDGIEGNGSRQKNA